MAQSDESNKYRNHLDKARERAKNELNKLKKENETHSINYNSTEGEEEKKEEIYESWVRGCLNLYEEINKKENGFIPDLQCQFFDRNGFIILRSFSPFEDEVVPMKAHMKFLVEEYWHPNDKDEATAIFRTDQDQIKAQGSSDYFLDSANNVHFFAENGAVYSDGSLKAEYNLDKMAALNKSGHALHLAPTISSPSSNSPTKIIQNSFYSYTNSQKIYDLVTSLGWKNPVVPQSMYIFKQPRIGGVVTSHQDSTFLHTTPKQSCLGLWLALDDATLTNGCLWVRPKSHKEPLRRKFKRNLDYFEIHNHSSPQMVFEDLTSSSSSKQDVEWEGSLPGGEVENEETIPSLLSAGFIPVECKAGDLLVFNGELDHLSLANTSEKQRHTFQLHMVEGEKAGVKWSESNWLQYPEGRTFFALHGDQTIQ